MTGLSEADCRYLQRAIEISRGALEDDGKSPFGALVVVADSVAGEGINRVAERRDPTAHAEVMALRAAGQALGRPVFEDGVLYSSCEPCPMCLAASYWARIPRVVYAATSHDAAASGFEDLQLYREIARPGSASSRKTPPAKIFARPRQPRCAAGPTSSPLPSSPSSENRSPA